ncbi:MAG: hypothetical protein O6940_04390 [Ignavibacteria bacterium]|nr:hypothetical protein [Ignavibacteria bacterium]
MGNITKTLLFSNRIILIVFLIGLSTIIFFSIIPEAFSQTIISGYKPEGIVLQHDERIYIVQHTGYSMLEGVEGRFIADSIIYGDIINLSDDTIFYIIMRGNVYKDEQLWEKTGYQQRWTFRYDYPWWEGNPTELAVSPFRIALGPGEASPFALWPGQTGWDCYEVWVETYELENIAEDITDERMRNDIVIKSGELDNKGNFKGKVFNPTEIKIERAWVNIVKYDTNDEIFAILGEEVGVLSPGKVKSYEIPVHLLGYPIKTHTDNLLYGTPNRIEVIAGGQTDWGYAGDFEDYDEKHPARLVSASQYYPNEPRPQYMNLEEIREKAKQDREKPINRNFCRGGEDTSIITDQTKQTEVPKSKILTIKTRIPDWIRNNAGWWAEGAIGDKDFVSGIQYLIKQKIMQIPEAAISDSEIETENKSVTDQGYIQVNGREFSGSRYNPIIVIISGEVEKDSLPIECDFMKPGEYYDDFVRITVGSDQTFKHMMKFDDFEPGEYHLDCKYKEKDFGSLSFSLAKSSDDKPVGKDSTPEINVPGWIKNNADWWSQGLISDDDFVKGIQYLVEQGIIKV